MLSQYRGRSSRDLKRLGKTGPDTAPPLQTRTVTVASAAITLVKRELAHAQRDSKQARGVALDEADLDRLPDILAQPKAVLYDTQSKGTGNPHVLLYVFDPADEAHLGKVVVRVNFRGKMKVGTAPRRMVTTNAVRTAGYVETGDLRDPRYLLLEGKLN